MYDVSATVPGASKAPGGVLNAAKKPFDSVGWPTEPPSTSGSRIGARKGLRRTPQEGAIAAWWRAKARPFSMLCSE